MFKCDFYEVLGVVCDVDEKVLKSVYCKMVM